MSDHQADKNDTANQDRDAIPQGTIVMSEEDRFFEETVVDELRKASPGVPGKGLTPLYVDSRFITGGGNLVA